MRFNNIKSKKWVGLIYFCLVIGFIIAIVYSFLFREETSCLAKRSNLIFIALILIVLFFYITAKYFEFDSDGLGLTFINKGLFISNFINYREHRAEFQKEKLKRYTIKNYIIYSKLNVYVKLKNNKIRKYSFNISFLSTKKKNALKKALNEVLKINN